MTGERGAGAGAACLAAGGFDWLRCGTTRAGPNTFPQAALNAWRLPELKAF